MFEQYRDFRKIYYIEHLAGLNFFIVPCNSEEPYFLTRPKNVMAIVGTSMTLPCEAAPSEGLFYYWELNGSKIANTTRRFMRNSDLHITRVDRERDAGEFTCVAEDVSGRNPAITSSPASLLIECELITNFVIKPNINSL
ncbi:hypothetical protein ABEB36_000048 [Hypothenemus hampei]|uniref:Ig-like domain-containing protein n=1 Tax=Hypothenemus hampei TaxID=57062 RepID=A0ABD1FA54_HYPHA